jgi:hypothetical protein
MNLANQLLSTAQHIGEQFNAFMASIKRLLINQHRKQWLTVEPIALNDGLQWSWSRTVCRVQRLDDRIEVTIGLAGHDVTDVRAEICGDILAVRVSLESDGFLWRAQPLPVSVLHAPLSVVWDRQAIKIELQIRPQAHDPLDPNEYRRLQIA